MRLAGAKKKKKEAEAISSEDVIACLEEGVIVLGPGLEVKSMNPAAERITGCGKGQAKNSPFNDAFPMNGHIFDVITRTKETGRSASYADTVFVSKDRTKYPVAVLSTPLFGSSGDVNGFIMTLRDLTPIKAMEEDLKRADRLATLGNVVSCIAHEIRNPLGGIKGAAQILKKRVSLEGAERECLQVILGEVERLDTLISSILDISSPLGIVPKPVDIHALIDETLPLFSLNETARGVKFELRCDTSLPEVMGDQAMLKQVLINLLKNAVEAMPSGGTIVISTYFLTESPVLRRSGRMVKFITFEVRDEGPGIPPEDFEKIFLPFYSTKPKGSGLGLAISCKIVNDLGGFIRVESPEEGGTVMKVFLPVAEPERVEDGSVRKN